MRGKVHIRIRERGSFAITRLGNNVGRVIYARENYASCRRAMIVYHLEFMQWLEKREDSSYIIIKNTLFFHMKPPTEREGSRDRFGLYNTAAGPREMSPPNEKARHKVVILIIIEEHKSDKNYSSRTVYRLELNEIALRQYQLADSQSIRSIQYNRRATNV